MSELVTIDIQSGVADVRLNRPNKYNALSLEMFDAIIAAGERLAEEPGVRVVVLSGNGKGFCAGFDMEGFHRMANPDGDRTSRGLTARSQLPENHAQRPTMVWKRLHVPVIAVIHGVAFGGGCQVALGADIRFMHPDAKMSVMEIKWGLLPDMAITQLLRDLVPLDVAKELTFTGRILSGEEALALGLVTHIHQDPHAAAMTLAREIAGKSPKAIQAGKRLLEMSWHADERTGLELEASLQGTLIGTPNQVEAVKANLENRVPVFKD